MGVTGLLDFVSSSTSDCHISQFAGQFVAVDVSCWLHRGASACAKEAALGEPTDKHLGHALKMIRLFRSHRITPVIVFDGGALPMKARTNAARRAARAEDCALGQQLLEQGQKVESYRAFQKAVTVTTHMARQLIAVLRRDGVPYLVAPYEADAQVAYLVQAGHCAVAVSEDSDLLVYGCPAVLTKLDTSGYGRLIRYEDLRFAEHGGRVLFEPWEAWSSGKKLIDMAVLAGCDYFEGLPGIGLKTAHALLRSHGSLEASAPHALPIKGRYAPASSDERATLLKQVLSHACRARRMFVEARCYDPTSGEVVKLSSRGSAGADKEDDRPNEVASPSADDDFLGPPISANLARELCVQASIDPVTLQRVEGSIFDNLPPPAPLPPARPTAGSAITGGASTAAAAAIAVDAAAVSASAAPRAISEAKHDLHADLAACGWGGSSAATAPSTAAPQRVSRFFSSRPSGGETLVESDAANARGSSSPSRDQPAPRRLPSSLSPASSPPPSHVQLPPRPEPRPALDAQCPSAALAGNTSSSPATALRSQAPGGDGDFSVRVSTRWFDLRQSTQAGLHEGALASSVPLQQPRARMPMRVMKAPAVSSGFLEKFRVV